MNLYDFRKPQIKSKMSLPQSGLEMLAYVSEKMGKGISKFPQLTALNEAEIVTQFEAKAGADFEAQALTGTGFGSGEGLISNIVLPPVYRDVNGGAFIGAGVQFLNNFSGVASFTSLSGMGDFVPAVCGTATTNDITGTTKTAVVVPYRYIAYLDACRSLLQQSRNAGELVAIFSAALENRKRLLSDRLCVDAVLTNPNVEAIDASLVTITNGKILQLCNDTVLNVSQYSNNVAIMCNYTGFSRLINERDSQGRPINMANYGFNYDAINLNGNIRDNKAVGYFNGTPVFIVPNKALGNSYKISASGVVLSTPPVAANPKITNSAVVTYDVPTAGNAKTVFIVGDMSDLGLVAGSTNEDVIYNSDTSKDWTSFANDDFRIGMATGMGAGVIATEAIKYFAI